MTRPILVTVAAGLFFFVLRPAMAGTLYPPPSLWSLVQLADHIVVADVESVELNAEPPGADATDDLSQIHRRDTHRAVLKIVESWKGTSGKKVKLDFNGFIACPSPGRFHSGKRMVAFLYRRDGKLEPMGETSTRYFDAPEPMEDLRLMVKSALAIQKSGFSDSQLHDQKRRWLVEAALRPGTRGDGLGGLSRRPVDLKELFQGRVAEREFERLEKEDQRQLARLFLSLQSAEGSTGQLMTLLPLLDGYEDPMIDAATVGLIGRLRSDGTTQPLRARFEELAATRLAAIGAAPSVRIQ